jgi:prophage antirepressor-like protein
MKQTKSTKTVANKMVVKKVVLKQLNNEKFGTVKVVKTEDDEGFACLDDLCDILNLSKKEVIEKLDGHLHTVSPKKTEVTKYDTDYVDEVGIYLLYFLSKEKYTIQVQNWLDKEFFQSLREQHRFDAGTDQDSFISDVDLKRHALRDLATANNVIKSGHFMKGKDIPELTLSHLIGWWHNLNDQTVFMPQFNCQSDCDVYKNIRMNVYLRKMVDGRVDMCTMHISFLDLDDDNREFFVIETVIPSSDVLDGSILDYIMEDQFLDEDIMEPGNLEIVLILNATMSFHRSRRIEKKEQQGLIEFL